MSKAVKILGQNHVEVSRRNLMNLLAALDRGDNATLTRYDKSAGSYLTVRAVEDWDHYGERPPGPMPLDNDETGEVSL